MIAVFTVLVESEKQGTQFISREVLEYNNISGSLNDYTLCSHIFYGMVI